MKRNRLVVLGGGISGYGSAILARKRGFDVFLSDAGRIASPFRERLVEWDVPFEEGGHTLDRLLDALEAVKSPGIPETAPVVQALRERGVRIISEIEFAGRYLDGARTICITGSNGKTTTTTLTHRILHDAGYRVALGGNIGESFAYSVATGHYDWYVLELSSFQLDGMYDFRADVGVLMNITPDHLDRYDHSFDKYARSKMRIRQNQRTQDFFVYFADDEAILSRLDGVPTSVHPLPFGAHPLGRGADGAWIEGDRLHARLGDRSVELDTARMRIRGVHNAYNAMAATLAALAAGVDPESIRRTIAGFEGVEHRLERVGEWGGVEWINDSKATNVDSVWYALESMRRPTVWIAGGTDKGNDYAPLAEFARCKVHTLVCMGVDNRKLVDAFRESVPRVVSTGSLDEAMQAARTAARPGDAVLLSPACASFDLFRNYEDRGAQFKAWIEREVADHEA